MMIWVDLRQFLEAPTWEAEQKLWHRLADEQRVILTPGGQQLHPVQNCLQPTWEAFQQGAALPSCIVVRPVRIPPV